MLSNVEVHGLDRAIRSSGYPYEVEIESIRPIEDRDIVRARKLGSATPNSGHDTFLKGITVHMDVTLTQNVWMQAMRYHWFDIVSSQSKMHRLIAFRIESSVSTNVRQAAINNLKDVIEDYKKGEATIDELMDNVPCGFELTAEVSTNYLQLKTMYLQRRGHKLKAWQTICDQIEQLPMFLELIRRG